MSGNVVQGPESWRANIARSLEPEPPADLAGGGGPPHDPGMEARVAVLEQIAKDTKDALVDLRTEMRGLRSEQRTDYRWLLSIMLGVGGALLAAMAKGFHWY